MRKLIAITGLIVLVALGSLTSTLIAQGPGGHHGPPFFAQLTEDQRSQVHEMVQQMRQEGATPQEIHEAVSALLEEFGIEFPDETGVRNPFWRIMNLLTEEQRTTIREMIHQMKEDGATPQEIRDAVVAQLEEWGIELPEHHGRPFRHIMSQLTEDQRAQVRELIEEMRESGATREEIREAVLSLLQEFGIELPEGGGWRHQLREIMQQLTPEQRNQIHDTIRQMHEADATRQEIHQAVIALLEEFGIEWPGNGHPIVTPDRQKIEARNYPNPFNLDTRITFTLPATDNVQIQIYNMAGQQVRSFRLGYQSEGTHSVIWNGLMDNGQSAPSGIYLYRITAGENSFTQRMLLLK